MLPIEMIQRIITAKQGDAIGRQVQDVANGTPENANPNALGYILMELQNLQGMNWQDVAEAIDELVSTLEDEGIEPKW